MKYLRLLFCCFLVGITGKTAIAGEWHPIPLQHRNPSSLVADASGNNILFNMGVYDDLWEIRSGVLDNLCERIYKDIPFGNFYYLSDDGEKILLLAKRGEYQNQLFLTEDSGNTWEPFEGPHLDDIDKVYIDKANPDQIIITNRKEILVYNFPKKEKFIIPLNNNIVHKFFTVDDSIYMLSQRYEKLQGKHIGEITRLEYDGNDWNLGEVILQTDRDFGINNAFFSDVLQMSNGNYIVSLYLDRFPENEKYREGRIYIFDENWQQLNRCGTEFPAYETPRDFIECVTNPGTLFAEADCFYRSTDYGSTWAQYSSDSLPANIVSSGSLYQQPLSGDLYLSLKSFGLYKSKDTGITWEEIEIPVNSGYNFLRVLNGIPCVYNHLRYSYLLQDNQWRRLDLADQLSIPNMTLSAPFYINGDTLLFSVGYYNKTEQRNTKSLAFTVDDGKSWSLIDNLEGWHYDYHNGEKSFYLISYNFDENEILLSKNFGSTWSKIDKPSRAFASGESYIYSTIKVDEGGYDVCRFPLDNGTAWERMYLDLEKGSRVAAIYPLNNHLMVADNNRECYWYDNRQWIKTGHLNTYLYTKVTLIEENNQLTVVVPFTSDNRIMVSRDSCQTWQDFTLDLPIDYHEKSFSDLAYDRKNKKIWLSTAFGILWCDSKELLNNQGEDIVFNADNPDDFKAYTCPFNSRIRLKYSLSIDTFVTINRIDNDGNKFPILETQQTRGVHYKYLDPAILINGRTQYELNTTSQPEGPRVEIMSP